MTLIELKTIDQVLLVVTRPTIASGDRNTVGIKVCFDSAWDGYDKTATFSMTKNTEVYEVRLEDDSCVVPAEVLTAPGTMYIGIRGTKVHDKKVKTSVIVSYRIKEGAPAGTSSEVPQTAVLYTEQDLTDEQKAQARANIGASKQMADIETLAMLTECGIIDPIVDAEGAFFVDKNDVLFVL